MAEGMLARTMSVLACFTEDEPAVAASGIADRTGIPDSTLYRLLSDLVAEGMLARAPGRTYTIGPRLWELGELSPLSLRLRETALSHMVRLYEATGENVHLAVLDGATPETSAALYVGRVTGTGSIPTLSRMGGRQPLHTTGVGKALLSTRDAEWLERFLAMPLQRETTHSVTDPVALRDEIARARSRGYATTREEMTLGNISVAAPVAAVQGLPPIALGVVVHLDKADVRRLSPLVIQAARELYHDLRNSH